MGRLHSVLAPLALCGCDQLFELPHVEEQPDAGSDAACALVELGDNFDDDYVDMTKWSAWWDPGASAREEGHEAVLDLGAGSVNAGRQAEFVTQRTHDFTGRQLTVEVTRISNVTTTLQAVLFIRNSPSTNSFAIVAEQGGLRCSTGIDGTYNLACDIAYNADKHRIWSMREHDQVITFAASDGTSWETLGATSVPFDITALDVGIYVFMDGPGIDPGFATFDDFSLCMSAQ